MDFLTRAFGTGTQKQEKTTTAAPLPPPLPPHCSARKMPLTETPPNTRANANLTKPIPPPPTATTSSASILQVGNFEDLRYGVDLFPMEDSSELLRQNPSLLPTVLQKQGYVLIRGYLDRGKVLQARKVVTNTLNCDFQMIQPPPDQARPLHAPQPHTPELNHRHHLHHVESARASIHQADAANSTVPPRAFNPNDARIKFKNTRMGKPHDADGTNDQREAQEQEQEEEQEEEEEGDGKGILLTGFTQVTHHRDVIQVLEGDALRSLMQIMMEGKEPATFTKKWVRVHGKNEFTDEHSDFYRFQNSQTNERAKGMMTAWVPLGDYSVSEGNLVVCEASHRLPAFHDDGEGESKMELPPVFYEWHNKRRNGSDDRNAKETRSGDDAQPRPSHILDTKPVWRYTNYRAGDVLIFDIRLIHASTRNRSVPPCFRISLDSRWQPQQHIHRELHSSFRFFSKCNTDENDEEEQC